MKYHYTDPLAAAWMAKHFKMQFGIYYHGKIVWDCESHGASGDWHPIRDWEHIAADAADGDAQPAYYIHPDSLPLLKPSVGDLCRWRYNPNSPNMIYIYGEYIYPNAPLIDTQFDRIIQRNGMSFHWPERREA